MRFLFGVLFVVFYIILAQLCNIVNRGNVYFMGNLLPCYSDVKPPRAGVWPGDAVSSAEMLEALKDCEELLTDERSKFFYLSATPCIEGCERYDNILRVIFNISGTCSMISAYDGEILNQELPPRSIVAGGHCNWNSTACRDKGEHYSYSVIFCRALTRLVFSKYTSDGQIRQTFYCHYPPASELLSEMLDSADKVINDRNNPRDRRMRALLTAIFEQFKLDVKHSDSPVAALPDNVAMAVHYIELNYFLPINCSSVADALQLNRTMLSNEFHRATGETMKDFIQKLRMEKACWLLQKQELKVSEVARECGFNDTGYFIKVFRRRFGKSPRKISKKNTLQ